MMRAQGSLEFMMTYAIAFAVVIGVIGSLSYAGVLKPEQILPDRCSVEPPFTCTDFAIQEDGVTIALSTVDHSLRIDEVVFSDPDDPDRTCGYHGSPQVLNDGQIRIETNSECEIIGKRDRTRLDMNIAYRTSTDGFARSASGSVFGPIS